jgi:isoleucyl-tRNA synthetase
VESVWWALSELFKQGLLYQDYKIVWWWPQGGTALSSGEVGQGYKEVDDPSVVVRFPVKGEATQVFLAWTTTPWTLPSNIALAVNAKETYATVGT